MSEILCKVCNKPVEQSPKGRRRLKHKYCYRKSDGSPGLRTCGPPELAERSGLTREQIEALTEAIAEVLTEGRRVQLTGFGAFRPHTLPPRVYDRTDLHNVIGGQKVIRKDARVKVLFSASDDLRVLLDPTYSPRRRKGTPLADSQA